MTRLEQLNKSIFSFQLIVDYYVLNSFVRKIATFESSILHSMKFIAPVYELFDLYIHVYIIDRNALYLCGDHVMKQDI